MINHWHFLFNIESKAEECASRYKINISLKPGPGVQIVGIDNILLSFKP